MGDKIPPDRLPAGSGRRSDATLTFTLTADETQNLAEQKYNYDVQITYADGSVDTFISSTMVMLEEVE